MSYLSLEEAENILWTAIVLCLKLDPDKTTDRVRIAWPTEGQPGWNKDEDRIFLMLTESGQDISLERDVVWEHTSGDIAIKHTGQMRVWQLDVVAYGPNSYDDQIKIRNMLFSQPFIIDGKEYNIPKLLNSNGLFTIPDIASPNRLPEIFGANWWQRADMRVFFNERMVYETESIPYFKAASVNFTSQQPSGNKTEIARSDQQDVIIEP